MPPAPEDKHQINHHKAESQETDPFLSETEKGSFEKQYNENVFPFQMNIGFVLYGSFWKGWEIAHPFSLCLGPEI